MHLISKTIRKKRRNKVRIVLCRIQDSVMLEKKISMNLSKTYQLPDDSLSSIHIKSLPTKFMLYLNELNSSIENCRDKTKKKKTQPDEKRRSSRSCDSSSQSKSWTSLQKLKYVLISGVLNNGKLHGKVQLKLSNGAIFRGMAALGEIQKGIMEFPDGVLYQGEFLNFVFEGHGKLLTKNGTKYIGNFIKGFLDKTGQIIYDNGDIYRGQIKNYKKHGEGVLQMTNGNKFVGQFQQGQITGYGTYYVNQFPLAYGMWQKGEFLGKPCTLTSDASF